MEEALPFPQAGTQSVVSMASTTGTGRPTLHNGGVPQRKVKEIYYILIFKTQGKATIITLCCLNCILTNHLLNYEEDENRSLLILYI